MRFRRARADERRREACYIHGLRVVLPVRATVEVNEAFARFDRCRRARHVRRHHAQQCAAPLFTRGLKTAASLTRRSFFLIPRRVQQRVVRRNAAKFTFTAGQKVTRHQRRQTATRQRSERAEETAPPSDACPHDKPHYAENARRVPVTIIFIPVNNARYEVTAGYASAAATQTFVHNNVTAGFAAE